MKLESLIAQARGGRVVRSDFISVLSIDRRLLADVSHKIAGGFPDADQVVLTLYPEHIPHIDSGVKVLRLSTELEAADVKVALRQLYAGAVGEVREERGALLVALQDKAAKQLKELSELGGKEFEVEEIGEHAGKEAKVRQVVVPSMRIDVVGARGFGVSRAYFQQGIEGGKVRLNGQVARGSSEIKEGDSLSADGLGRIDFKRVVNETRRGNFKVELDVHR